MIDFGDASGGRPLDDIALLCRNWLQIDLGTLKAGYGPAPFWDDARWLLSLAQLRLFIGYAAYDIRARHSDNSREDLADLKTLLASTTTSSRHRHHHSWQAGTVQIACSFPRRDVCVAS